MRALIALPAALALLVSLGGSVAASCAPPATVAENGARAVAVVYGTVTGTGPGSVTLHVDRVLKGSVANTLTVFIGPGRGGTAGTLVATSVDYSADTGTDHVLYLIQGEDGQLETNACIGSHPGGPTPEETAHFAAGSSSPAPTAGTPAPGGQAQEGGASPTTSTQLESPWLALLALAGALLAGLLLARRRFGPVGGQPTR